MATVEKLYVFVQCGMGMTDEIGNKLVRMDGIYSVASISGEYDLFVEIKVNSDDPLDSLVKTKIHTVPGILRTNTVLAFQFYDPNWLGFDAGSNLNET